LIKMSGFL